MANKMIETLKRLGVSFDPPREHRMYKFESGGYMPLVVEQWMLGGKFQMSVAHYGEQMGDLMKDPDILYEVRGDQLHPIEFQNDYVGIYQNYPDNPTWVRDILDFTRTWARNIGHQYKPEDLKEQDG